MKHAWKFTLNGRARATCARCGFSVTFKEKKDLKKADKTPCRPRS